MRAAADPQVVRSPEGLVAAIFMGGNYCAEHEWGINPIKAAFGIYQKDEHPEVFGIDRRRVRRVPSRLGFLTEGKKGILFYDVFEPARYLQDNGLGELRFQIVGDRPKLTKKGKPSKRQPTEWVYSTVAAAWDERSFAFLATASEERDALAEIHQGLLKQEALIMLSGADGPFGAGGIVSMAEDALL